MAEKRCVYKSGAWNCGSYQFNLYKDDIDQGDLCDVHYWQAKAQRPWVGLDEDEIREIYGKDLNYRDGNYVRYAKSVEAQLKERNGY